MRNLQMVRELVRVVSKMEAAGISVIPLKGPLLGQLAYEDLAVRQALDLDVLVREEQFWHAKDLLHAMGYQSLRALTESEQKEFVSWHASYELIHPGQNIVIELHHNFLPANATDHLPSGEVWERHTRVTMAGVTMRSLDFHDLVIYLCIHGARHEWAKLKWLCDLGGLMHRQPSIDWPLVCQRAERTGSLRAVALACWLIKRCFGLPPPEPVHAHMQTDSVLPSLGWAVLNREVGSGLTRSDTSWRSFWFHVRARERWRDRLPYLIHTLRLAIVPSQLDRGFVSLPKPFSWLYYLVRPVRVLRDIMVQHGLTFGTTNEKTVSRTAPTESTDEMS
jgi:hypothetical protein